MADHDHHDHADDGRSPTDEERAGLFHEQMKRLKVADLLQDMMMSLVTVGYQKLGLTTETRDLRDLPGAHLAIEVLKGAIHALGKEEGEKSVEVFRSTLATMQLSYVRAVEESAKEPADADQTEPAVEDSAEKPADADQPEPADADQPEPADTG